MNYFKVIGVDAASDCVNGRKVEVSFFILISSLLMFGTVFSPFLLEVVGFENYYDLKRFIVCFLVCTLAGFFLLSKVEVVAICYKAKLFIFFALTAFLLSFMKSEHKYWSLVELSNYIVFFFIFLFSSSLFKCCEKERVLHGFVLSLMFFSFAFFVKYWLFLLFTVFDGRDFGIQDIVNGFFNVRFYNQIQVVMLPLLFVALTSEWFKRVKVVAFILISMHWAVLLQTEARGALLSVIFSFFPLLYISKISTEKRSLLTSFLWSILAGVFLWLVFIVSVKYFFVGGSGVDFGGGASGRLEIWLYILSVIKDNFWFGFGPMAYAWAEIKPLYNAHPHNLLFQIFYEYGFFGLCVIFSSILLFFIPWAFDERDERGGIDLFFVKHSIISALCYSMFSGVFVMPFSQLCFVLVMALYVCYSDNSRPSHFQFVRYRFLSFFILFVSVLLIISSYQDVGLKGDHVPRIWIRGLIAQ
ncbi:O-antigen ligase family protein [Shewanella insulae]|uniref:O-antigen ligase family protein n=1 Tax=Shewanella insulae TaxID=2681496 RepID=UPI001EFD4779|nr:O-antigen ligase family protein [Shewanella insulae]MCG9738533.1 O-antigen ligase family protein [Shewanella insulae]